MSLMFYYEATFEVQLSGKLQQTLKASSRFKLEVVAHTFNFSTWEAEADRAA